MLIVVFFMIAEMRRFYLVPYLLVRLSRFVCKVKAKVVPVRAMKEYSRSRGLAALILNLINRRENCCLTERDAL